MSIQGNDLVMELGYQSYSSYNSELIRIFSKGVGVLTRVVFEQSDPDSFKLAPQIPAFNTRPPQHSYLSVEVLLTSIVEISEHLMQV